ncbi:hypothetical protein SAMN02745216_01364 [Desulfatibacillum alkenivorans DSM 16219]|uniref:Uncharacterized protein n=1 Tax=Desulfatibacillum alkenivorans DSM 16219 TaxID=1121393 RepID=A0A1M6I5V0_9BACT|nr:hypothetical protein SAMN02745216_01364 [Desulfatibacillum alkenivorans DSM 16219]
MLPGEEGKKQYLLQRPINMAVGFRGGSDKGPRLWLTAGRASDGLNNQPKSCPLMIFGAPVYPFLPDSRIWLCMAALMYFSLTAIFFMPRSVPPGMVLEKAFTADTGIVPAGSAITR